MNLEDCHGRCSHCGGVLAGCVWVCGVGLNWKDHVVIDKKYFRPTEVDNFKGDASRAKKVLGWKP